MYISTSYESDQSFMTAAATPGVTEQKYVYVRHLGLQHPSLKLLKTQVWTLVLSKKCKFQLLQSPEETVSEPLDPGSPFELGEDDFKENKEIIGFEPDQ